MFHFEIIGDDDPAEWINAGLVDVLAASGRFDVIDADDKFTSAYIHGILSGELSIYSSIVTHQLALVPALCNALGRYDLVRFGFTRRDLSGRMVLFDGVRISEKLTRSRHSHISAIADDFVEFVTQPSDEAPDSYPSWEKVIQPILELGKSTDFAIVRIAAILSVAMPSVRTDAEISLNDESVDIFTRFNIARRYRGSIKWWTSQFDSSASFDEKLRVLQGALTICGPRTLGKLLSAASGFINALSGESVDRVIRGINRIRYRANSRSDLAGLELDNRALIMYVRSTGFTEADIPALVRRADEYDGDDPTVVNFFLEIMPAVQVGLGTEDVLEERTWRHLFELAHKAYLQDIVDEYGIHRLVRISRSMPIETAREVSAHRDVYPCSLVELAERRCLQHVASHQRPLLAIANESWWPDGA